MLEMDSKITATIVKIFVEVNSCLTIVLVAGGIIQLYNLSVLRVRIIEVLLPDMHSYNVSAGQTNYSSWSSKYLTNKHNNIWK